MAEAEHILEVSLEVGQRIWVRAAGDPAKMVAYGTAAAVAVLGTAVGYGSYVYGRKVLGWLTDDN